MNGVTLATTKAAAVSAIVRNVAADQRARDVQVSIKLLQSEGAKSLREIAFALTNAGIKAPRGGVWSAAQVKRAMKDEVAFKSQN